MSTSWHDMQTQLMRDVREHGKPLSGPFLGRDVLILSTKGARSGEHRETPLVYHRDGDRLVIIASKGGAPKHPAWYHNLRAHPVVTVDANGQRFQARAHVVDGDDYERLYKQHADINPGFWDYRKRTSRKIPVVVLERIPLKAAS